MLIPWQARQVDALCQGAIAPALTTTVLSCKNSVKVAQNDTPCTMNAASHGHPIARRSAVHTINDLAREVGP
jgi:hypothetical protein